MSVQVESLDRWGERGWRWLETHPTGGRVLTCEYRTDGYGRGLFVRAAAGNWRRLLGVVEYSELPYAALIARREITRRRMQWLKEETR